MKNLVLTNRVQKSAVLGLFLLGLLLPNPCPAALLPPVITEQPQSQSVEAGGSVTFHVVVTSFGSTSYQWRKDGADIPGATSSSYTIASVQPSDAANYSVRISNARGVTTSANATLTVVALNVAPVLDDSRSPALAAVNQGAGAPVGAAGTLVSALVDFVSPAGQLDNVAEPDAGTLLGIAVTGVDTAHGAWFYSINNGTTWNALGAVSESNARLLAADAGTRLYFQPNPGYERTLANAIAFRAWDQTSGTNGGTSATTGTHTFRDLFNVVSYNNNDGTESWATPWVEDDSEGGGPDNGSIAVRTGELRVQTAYTGNNIYREVNLSGALAATLSFSYANGASSPGSIQLQVSGNGGQTYTTLEVFDAATNSGSGTKSIDISSYMAANTRVRFLVQTGTGKQDNIRVDDVQIQYSSYGGGTSAFSATTDTASLVVNPPLALASSGSASMTPEGFSFGLSVPVGATYIIEASSNSRDWTPIATNVATSASMVFTDSAAGSFSKRFYRARVQ